MGELRHPSKPLHQYELKLDATLGSKEDSGEEDYEVFFLFGV